MSRYFTQTVVYGYGYSYIICFYGIFYVCIIDFLFLSHFVGSRRSIL